MKSIITVKADGVILLVAESVYENEVGIVANTPSGEVTFPSYIETSVFEISDDVANGVVPGRDCYSGTIGVFKNPLYQPPPKTQMEIEQEIEMLKLMVADLGLQVGGGL